MSGLERDRSLELTFDLLKGAIDIHVHAGPHLKSSPRRADPVEVALEARDVGMRAVVFKDVFEMTNGTAWLVNRHVPGITVYGGLMLNTVYGGMNPRAFKTAIHYGDGAKYLDFGAHSTYYQAAKEGRVVDGEFVPLSELYPEFRKEELERAIRIPVEGDLGPKLDEMLTLLAENPHIYMDTGHVSSEEATRLLELKEDYGYERVVVSSSVTKISTMDQLKYMVEMGGLIEFTFGAYTAPTPIPLTHYYVEKEYASIDEGMDALPDSGIREVADQIRELGAANCIMSTDFGRYALSTPTEGLRQFIACMLDLGITPDEIRMMVKTNPEWLLGLDPVKEATQERQRVELPLEETDHAASEKEA